VDVPALEVTFLVTGIPQEEQVQDSDELAAVGKLEPSGKKSIIEYMQLGN